MPSTNSQVAMPDAGRPLVRLRGIVKRFPGVVALDRVDLDLYPGKIHALTGENGSGKSTLAKILYGAHQPDAGTIEVDGEPTTIRSPSRALELGIVAISQELTLAPTLSVAENVLMGRLPRTRAGTVDWRNAGRLANEVLSRVGVRTDPRRRVGDLSIELQQEVEIARAVSVRSRLLILDEATSSLSESAAKALLVLMEDLSSQGVAILMISHRMPEVYRARRATVLRDGRLVGVVPLPETDQAQLVRMMVGREIGDLYRKRTADTGDAVLSVRDVKTADGRLLPTTLEVRRGEILGVAGLVGSGKAELGLALAGAIACEGEVRVDGRPVTLRNPRASIAAGIAFVPDDRKTAAILPTRSVMENLSAPWTGRLKRARLILDRRRERQMCAATMERFRITARSLDAGIQTLSGGNQQKVILGRWFTLTPRVLVLSEPTRGVDVGAKQEIYGFIQDLAAQDVAVLMISSELPELLGVADRIVVMFQGELRAEFSAAEATEDAVAHVAIAGTPLASVEEVDS